MESKSPAHSNKTPTDNIVPDSHHSDDVMIDDLSRPLHGVARSPTCLNERRARLCLPRDADSWKILNEELEIALSIVSKKWEEKSLSCEKVNEKFEGFLYHFIYERISQLKPENNGFSKSRLFLVWKVRLRELSFRRSFIRTM